MFITASNISSKFNKIYKHHLLAISTENVYFQNVRALRTIKLKYIDKETYDEYYKNILADIDLDSSPIDTVIPTGDENAETMFTVNAEIPEFQKVKTRVTFEDMKVTLPATHPAIVAVIDDPRKFSDVLEEVYINFVLHKYLIIIDTIHLEILSNLNDVIEYVVNNITEKDFKQYIHSTKINTNKCKEKLREMVFTPEFSRTAQFYASENLEQDYGIRPFSVDKLMNTLITNIDTNTDTCIVSAIYYTMSFGITDIVAKKDDFDNIPHVKYIRDVLSKIC